MPAWEVRPAFFVPPDTEPDDLERVRGFLAPLPSLGRSVAVLAAGPQGGRAVSATLLIEAATAGEAADEGLRHLEEALQAAGVPQIELHEVIVEPGWPDPRDW